MSLIKELLFIREEAHAPIELKTLFGSSRDPKFAKKYLEKLWGTSRIVWHGDSFFSGDDLGPAYKKAEDAAMEALKTDSDEIQASVYLEVGGVDGAEDHRGSDEYEFSYSIKDAQTQEVYLGYSPKRDTLYIGFDAWANAEDEYNEGFEEAFREATGVDFDDSDEDHMAVADKAWKAFTSDNSGFLGLLFTVTHSDGDYHAELQYAEQGGFYKAIHRKLVPKDVHDIRLD